MGHAVEPSARYCLVSSWEPQRRDKETGLSRFSPEAVSLGTMAWAPWPHLRGVGVGWGWRRAPHLALTCACCDAAASALMLNTRGRGWRGPWGGLVQSEEQNHGVRVREGWPGDGRADHLSEPCQRWEVPKRSKTKALTRELIPGPSLAVARNLAQMSTLAGDKSFKLGLVGRKNESVSEERA